MYKPYGKPHNKTKKRHKFFEKLKRMGSVWPKSPINRNMLSIPTADLSTIFGQQKKILMNKPYCKNCNSELFDSSNSIDWYISLENREMPLFRSGWKTDAYIYPRLPENEPHDFCGLGCLSQWAEKKVKS